MWKSEDFNLNILDVTLPDGTGYEICQEIRVYSDIPILFLTAADDEMDITMGLDIGGDDYLPKPFKLAVLFSRINALLRRSEELTYYDVYREKIKGMILEPEKKITPRAWQKELDVLLPRLEETKKPYAQTVTTLASIELLEYNKTDLERMLGNERRAREKQDQQQTKKHNRNGQGLE